MPVYSARIQGKDVYDLREIQVADNQLGFDFDADEFPPLAGTHEENYFMCKADSEAGALEKFKIKARADYDAGITG